MPHPPGLILLVFALLLAACTPRVIPAGPAITAPVLDSPALVMADGARLPLKAWLPAGPPRAVLLGLHGMNDAAEPFLEDAAPLFTAAGVAVYAYDQRGFGGAGRAAKVWRRMRRQPAGCCACGIRACPFSC